MKIIKKINIILIIAFINLINAEIATGKTIQINGISVSIDVEVERTTKSLGTSINEEKEEDEEKKEKLIDEYVNIDLKIKNNNLYEAAEIKVVEKINSNFKQIDVKKVPSTHTIKVGSNEEKKYEYNYKYHRSFLKEQFNKIFNRNNENIENEERIKEKSEIENKEIKEEDEEKKKKAEEDREIRKKERTNIILLIIVLIIVGISISFIIYMVVAEIKKKDNGYDKDIGYFLVFIIATILISSINKEVKAKEYIPMLNIEGIIERGEIEEKVEFNGRIYEFKYEIEVKYENKNKIEDLEKDTDGDGLTDYEEYIFMTDLNNVDSDGDTLSDYLEVMVLNYNPNSKWTFNDGISDANRDYDEDGLTNKEELEYKTNLDSIDTDKDGLTDYEEVKGIKSKDGKNEYKTNPNEYDTDGDTINDKTEIKLGLDPLNSMTDGITLDSERKIKQEFEIKNISEQLKKNRFEIVKIEGEIKGDIEEAIKIEEYKNMNPDVSDIVIDRGITIEFDEKNKGNEIEITIDVEDNEEGAKKFTFVKYEEGEMKYIETKLEGKELKAKLGEGNYGIVDVEKLLRKINVGVE